MTDSKPRIDLVSIEDGADKPSLSIRCGGVEAGVAAIHPNLAVGLARELAWYFDERDRMTAGTRARASWIDRQLEEMGASLYRQVFGDIADADARGALSNASLTLVVCGPPVVQSLPWELIRNPDLPHPYAITGAVVRSASIGQPALYSSFVSPRILFLSGRPFDNKDVPYGAVLGSLMAAYSGATELPSIEIVSPPTYAALEEVLRQRPFDIVHIDTHGRLLHWRQVEQFIRQFGGEPRGAPFDGLRPFLFFSPVGGSQSIVSAESISALLAQAGVRCVVMNSCESGATGATAVDEATASLASAIHAAGVHIVVGMNRTVTVDAANELFRAFYTELFSGGSALAAARAARSALARKGQSRETASGELLIRGSDWMIPCIFQSDDVMVARRPGQSMAAAYASEAAGKLASVLHDLTGVGSIVQRVFDSLAKPRSVALFGMRGVGKRSIASAAAQLLVVTGKCRRLHTIDAAYGSPALSLLEGHFPEWRGISGIGGHLQRTKLARAVGLSFKGPDLRDSVVLLDNLGMQATFFAHEDGRFIPQPALAAILDLLRESGAKVLITVTGDPTGFRIDDTQFEVILTPPVADGDLRRLFLRTISTISSALPEGVAARLKDASVLVRTCGGSSLYVKRLAHWLVQNHAVAASRNVSLLSGIHELFMNAAIVRQNLGRLFHMDDLWAAMATVISLTRGCYRLSDPPAAGTETDPVVEAADAAALEILKILRIDGCVTPLSSTLRVWRLTPEVIPLTGFATADKMAIVNRIVSEFPTAYVRKAQALIRPPANVNPVETQQQIHDQLETELLNYLHAALSSLAHGNHDQAIWILMLMSAYCPSFLPENECRFLVDMIDGFLREAIARDILAGALTAPLLRVIETVDLFRASVDTREGYERGSIARLALGIVSDTEARYALQSALDRAEEIMAARIDGATGFHSKVEPLKITISAEDNAGVRPRALGLLIAGINAFGSGRRDLAEQHFAQLREWKSELANTHLWPVFLREEGALLSSTGRTAEGFECVAEALAIFEARGDHAAKATTLRVLSGVYRNAGDNESARTLLKEALQVFIDLEIVDGSAECLLNLGALEAANGRAAIASPLFRESLRWFQLSGLATNHRNFAAFNLALIEIETGQNSSGWLRLLLCAALSKQTQEHLFLLCCRQIAEYRHFAEADWLDSRARHIAGMTLAEIVEISTAPETEARLQQSSEILRAD